MCTNNAGYIDEPVDQVVVSRLMLADKRWPRVKAIYVGVQVRTGLT